MAQFTRILPTDPISAFNDHDEMIMTAGKPVVQWHLSVPEVREFVQTLEKAYDEEPNYIQRDGLQRIICTLKAALHIHKRQHEDFVASAPTGADLEEYLFAYAKAMSAGEIK
jgi:hypothetical protein